MAKVKIFTYLFDDKSLLEEALTHPSHRHNAFGEMNYERMEFLGDTVLSTIISTALFHAFPQEAEGKLARRRSAIVCGETLADVAKNTELPERIKMGESEKETTIQDSNLENVLEAVIGAIYLDGGLEACQKAILPLFNDLIHDMVEPPKDAKTRLQEWVQQDGLSLPNYSVVEERGPAHSPEFIIQVRIEGHMPVMAKGHSKKKAEQNAAEKFLDKITTEDAKTNTN